MVSPAFFYTAVSLAMVWVWMSASAVKHADVLLMNKPKMGCLSCMNVLHKFNPAGMSAL